MYIKLDKDMNLAITVNETIYRGDNLAGKIVFLMPMTVGETDLASAVVYLNYIRADGSADVVVLERMSETHNESYYQYSLPIDSKLTRYPGEVCAWIQIYAGTPSNPMISKSGECMIYIKESADADFCMTQQQLTALYQLQRRTESELERIEAAVASKADGIVLNTEDGTIQLSSNGNLIGESVIISPEAVNDEQTTI